jgi:hypothetical protein
MRILTTLRIGLPWNIILTTPTISLPLFIFAFPLHLHLRLYASLRPVISIRPKAVCTVGSALILQVWTSVTVVDAADSIKIKLFVDDEKKDTSCSSSSLDQNLSCFAVSKSTSLRLEFSASILCCIMLFVPFLVVACVKGGGNKFCDGYWKTDARAQIAGQVTPHLIREHIATPLISSATSPLCRFGVSSQAASACLSRSYSSPFADSLTPKAAAAHRTRLGAPSRASSSSASAGGSAATSGEILLQHSPPETRIHPRATFAAAKGREESHK